MLFNSMNQSTFNRVIDLLSFWGFVFGLSLLGTAIIFVANHSPTFLLVPQLIIAAETSAIVGSAWFIIMMLHSLRFYVGRMVDITVSDPVNFSVFFISALIIGILLLVVYPNNLVWFNIYTITFSTTIALAIAGSIESVESND